MPSKLLQVVNNLFQTCYNNLEQAVRRAVARALIGGGGLYIHISGSDRLISFEMKLILKEVSRAELEKFC